MRVQFFLGVADKFISDVRTLTAKCLADPEACDKGSAAIYGMAQSIPDRSVVDQISWFVPLILFVYCSIAFTLDGCYDVKCRLSSAA